MFLEKSGKSECMLCQPGYGLNYLFCYILSVGSSHGLSGKALLEIHMFCFRNGIL